MTPHAAPETWRPPHAYLPGRTARHDEALFAPLKAGIDPRDLAASTAWRVGLGLYRAGFFWEAHEMWEAVWMAAAENSREKRLVQAMIQRANAGLKRRMTLDRAAARLDQEAHALFHEIFAANAEPVLGIAAENLAELEHWRSVEPEF